MSLLCTAISIPTRACKRGTRAAHTRRQTRGNRRVALVAAHRIHSHGLHACRGYGSRARARSWMAASQTLQTSHASATARTRGTYAAPSSHMPPMHSPPCRRVTHRARQSDRIRFRGNESLPASHIEFMHLERRRARPQDLSLTPRNLSPGGADWRSYRAASYRAAIA